MADRDAPKLLQYKPTYHSFLKTKEERQEKNRKRKRKGKAKADQAGPLTEPELGINVPLDEQFAHPLEGPSTQAEETIVDLEMGRGDEIESLRKKKSGSRASKQPAKKGTAGEASKRQRTEHASSVHSDKPPTTITQTSMPPISERTVDLESPAKSGGPTANTEPTDKSVLAAAAETYRLSFKFTFAGQSRKLNVKDGVADDHRLGLTLLSGLALPEDMKKIPAALDQNLEDMYTHIAQVCPSFVLLPSSVCV